MNEKKRVLIIDDDNFLLDIYSVKFGNEGYDVSVSLSADDALKTLRDGYKPDIVVLDLIMQGTSGVDFLKEIKKEKLAEGSVLVVLSNQSGKEDFDKVIELGVHGYIVKATSTPTEVFEEVVDIYEKNKRK